MSARLDSATNQAVQRTASDYDRLPYRSLPYSLTRPTHVAAIAQTFGLAMPDVTTARVLEMGMLRLSTAPAVPMLPTRSAGPSRAPMPPAARRGTVSLHHVSVPLDGPSRTLLPLLDGTRDRAALVQCVLDMMDDGSIVLQHDGEAIADPDVTRKAVTELVNSTIAKLAAAALLSA